MGLAAQRVSRADDAAPSSQYVPAHAANDRQFIAVVLLDVLEEIGVVRQNNPGILVPLVPLPRNLGHTKIEVAVVDDRAMEKDRIVRVIRRPWYLLKIREDPGGGHVETVGQSPTHGVGVIVGIHHQHAAAVGSLPPAGTLRLQRTKGIRPVVIDSAAEIANARNRPGSSAAKPPGSARR